MTTITADPTSTPTAADPAARGIVTQARVIHSEWIKLRTLRSTFYTLLAAMVSLIGLAALFCWFTATHWSDISAADRASYDPALTSMRGFSLAQIAVGVLGVLVISGEYATGMIRASLSAVPRRLPVLWAKAGLYAAVVWVVMTVAALISFLLGMALLSGKHHGASLADPGVTKAVLGAGLYLTVVGLLGVAIGALIRNTAGGVATVFGLLLVVPVLAEALPSSWSDHVNQWLPGNAGTSIMSVHRDAHTLGPWTGLVVFFLYAMAALAAAAVLLKRRDA